jgi:hypothetical protein
MNACLDLTDRPCCLACCYLYLADLCACDAAGHNAGSTSPRGRESPPRAGVDTREEAAAASFENPLNEDE